MRPTKPAGAIEDIGADGSVKAGGNADALIEWFESGEGADRINWGTEGDHERCVEIASVHMTEEQAHGFCQLREMAVTGQTTSEHAADERGDKESDMATATKRGTRGKAAERGRDFDPTKLPGFETKDLPVTGVKILDLEQGIVECYVAGIGNKDDGGDIIEPGFFEKSLAKGIKPKGVWAHDWKIWVAKCLDTYEVKAGDARLAETKLAKARAGGQYVKAQFNLETQAGREAFSNVKFFGDECEWSIGYVPTEAPTDEKGRHLIDGEWYEFSPVLFGMNRATSTLAAKGLEALTDAGTLKDALDAIEGLLDGEPGGDQLVARLRGLADAEPREPESKGKASHSHDDSPEDISDHLEAQHGVAKGDQPDGPAPRHALHEEQHDGDIAQQYEADDDDDVEEKPRRRRPGMKDLPAGETRVPQGKQVAARDLAHKVRVTVAGSYEAVQEDLCQALREWSYMHYGSRARGMYLNLEATFDDAVIFGVTDWDTEPYIGGYGDSGGTKPRFYRMDWKLDGDDVVFGPAVEVDVSAVLEDDEPEPMTALATASLERLAAARAAKLQEAKVGARHSKADTEMLQGIHDAACTLGAKCAMETEEKGRIHTKAGGSTFTGYLTFEGVWSDEGEDADGNPLRRYIEPGALTWELPVPLLMQDDILPHHGGAEVVGRIDSIERMSLGSGNVLTIKGVLDTTENAALAEQWIREGMARNLSADIAEGVKEQGEEGERITGGRVVGGTITPFPGFKNARILTLGEEKLPMPRPSLGTSDTQYLTPPPKAPGLQAEMAQAPAGPAALARANLPDGRQALVSVPASALGGTATEQFPITVLGIIDIAQQPQFESFPILNLGIIDIGQQGTDAFPILALGIVDIGQQQVEDFPILSLGIIDIGQQGTMDTRRTDRPKQAVAINLTAHLAEMDELAEGAGVTA